MYPFTNPETAVMRASCDVTQIIYDQSIVVFNRQRAPSLFYFARKPMGVEVNFRRSKSPIFYQMYA